MLVSIPLTALLTLAATIQAPEGGTKASAVAPILGEEVAVVVHLDLMKWNARTSVRRVLGKLADEEDVSGVTKAVGGWVDAMKEAGAKDLFVLFDPADMPGMPIAVVPLGGGADGRAISEVLSGKGLNAAPPNAVPRWPASETIRGVVVAGTPAALARIRDAKPSARPELAAALAAGGDAPIQVAIIPSTTQRRAIEESTPTLPPQLGGEPITTLSRGMSWASVAMAFEPRPTLRAVVQGKDADAAKALRKVFQDALDFLTKMGRNDPAVAELAEAIGQMKPVARGDRIDLEADLEKTAAIVAVPVRQAREAARRSQCTNNLKQIGLAMHNYHSAHNAFPAAFSASKDGKPLLSWRVHILPFLEQKELYDQFHLDEAWDSPHNKALISRMPKLYACPSGDRLLAGEGKTTYLTPRGPATIFPGGKGVKIQEITDGTSNTIFVVDAGDDAAVIWTQPADWEVTPEFKSEGLFGHHPRGTNVGFADGSVKFIMQTIAPKVLQALMTRNGGEVIRSDDF